MAYSASEYFDMALMLGACGSSANRAALEYARLYPSRRHPSVNVFRRLETRARESGNLVPCPHHEGGPGRYVRTPEIEERVLRVIFDDPTLSVRQIALRVGLKKDVVHNILKEYQFHPYHFSKVQKLEQVDYPDRIQFCEWLLNKNLTEPGFSERILFSDECLFTTEGAFNVHNYHWWAEVNPHVIREGRHQRRWSVNVWAGILGKYLIGPHILPPRLDGESYKDFLDSILPTLLENIPLSIRRQMYYHHDGAGPHYALIVRQFLNNRYPRKWIGRGGPIKYPARSPDLNPLDYFLWGHLKEQIYKTDVTTRQDFTEKFQAAISSITSEMLGRTQQSLLRRLSLCCEMQGGHFEHLL